ncbi:hypothetical protein GPJ56_002335 [Histomonas meleagridis]|uniref:uncharacterized protein n=1 Tax=Histomonas meleagridis TaxID=135588 RepID=UPI00355A997B|nr:hypothetical protein GPJ56_002335 [Histomonas meleagridis]KAH0804596.1 hypothetical protein GO595_003426 [Histomonas meleagridis]
MENFIDVISFIENLETKYESVIRISIGSTFYRAICFETESDAIVRFGFEMLHELQNLVCVVVTKGNATVGTVLENELIPFVAGKVVERCDECIANGEFGKCYLDESIQDKLQIDDPNIVVIK